MLLLFDSSLIDFKVPPKSRLAEPCTADTLRKLEMITALANHTHGIKIVCSPNIWAYGDQDLFWESKACIGEPSLVASDITLSSTSLFSAISVTSSKSQGCWPDDTDYFDLPELMPSDSGFKRLFLRSDGKPFDVREDARFFVIKSYNGLDVQASIQNGIWASTELGNKRLDKAFREARGGVYLFFSVNSSAKFCGVAKMQSAIDFTQASDIWVESSRWKGIFPVEWLIIKEVPNRLLRHLRVQLNENKPVANSRDTQELPFDIGIAMMGTFDTYID